MSIPVSVLGRSDFGCPACSSARTSPDKIDSHVELKASSDIKRDGAGGVPDKPGAVAGAAAGTGGAGAAPAAKSSASLLEKLVVPSAPKKEELFLPLVYYETVGKGLLD